MVVATKTMRESLSTAYGTAAVWVSVHTSDPGANGTAEASGGSPGYARKPTTWSPGAVDGVNTGSTVTIDVPGGIYTHIGLWTAASGGAFRDAAAFPNGPVTKVGQSTLTVTPQVVADLGFGVNVVSVAFTGTGTLTAVVTVGASSGVVTAVKAVATTAAVAPFVSGASPGTVAPARAIATTQAGTPVITGGPVTVTAVRAVATTTAGTPTVTGSSPVNAAFTGTGTLTAVTVARTAVGALFTGTGALTAATTVGTATYINDNFTGTNGTAWNAAYWTTAITTTGSSATIQANQGRLNTGTLTGGAGKQAMRYVGAAVADTDISGQFTFVNVSTVPGTLQIVCRANSILDWQNEYLLIIIPGLGAAYIQKNVAGVNTTLGTITMAFTQGTQYGFRFRIAGSSIQSRVWTGTEPGTWNVDVTDTAIPAAGYFGVMAQNVSTAGFLVDLEAIVATGIGTAPFTGIAAFTGTGTLTAVVSGGSVGINGVWSSGVSMYGLDVPTFATWRGSPVPQATTWADNTAYNSQASSQFNPGSEYGTWTGNADWACGAIWQSPNDGLGSVNTWAQAASGASDAFWTTVINNVKAKWLSISRGTLYIRFAHEMNGNWFQWSVHPGEEADFRAAWQRFYNLKQVLFPAAKLAFGTNGNSLWSYNWSTALWPGDAYVDVVSVDWYSNHWIDCGSNVNNLTLDGGGGPYGLEAYRQFALAHGKPLAISEWGVNDTTGDQPAYIQQMHDFSATNSGTGPGQLLYEDYFNLAQFAIYPEGVAGASALHPNCAILYKGLLWGRGNTITAGFTGSGAFTVTTKMSSTVTGVHANATTTAPAPFVSGAGIGVVANWLTTGNQSNTYTPQTGITRITYNGTQGALPVNIDTAVQYQSMIGFGAAVTDAATSVIWQMPTIQRTTLMNELFSPTTGLGLTFMRLPMGASDFARFEYTYDDNGGTADPTLAAFSIAPDLTYTVPLIQAALAINPALKIIACPWSPPPWMKTPAAMRGGTLNTTYQTAYAQYFVKFIQAYAAQGIPIWAVTPQNEPENSTAAYPSSTMTAAQQVTFIGGYLGPAFTAASITTKIITYDHNWDDTSYAQTVFADTTAGPYTSGVAWHAYAGSVPAQTTVHNAYPAKDTYFTEITASFPGNFASDLQWHMREIDLGAPNNWARGVIYWNLALNATNGPLNGGYTQGMGLVRVNADNTVDRFAPYYAKAHMSPVRPGAVRVSANTYGAGFFTTSAYLNVDGSEVLVVMCDAGSAQTFKVIEGGMEFTVTMQPGDVRTFKWAVGGSQSVAPARAIATTTARTPTVVGGGSGAATVTAVHADDAAAGNAPTITGQTIITGGGPATANTTAIAPTVTAVAAGTVTAVKATSTSQAVAPLVFVVSSGTVNPPRAIATTAAGTPTVTAIQNATVAAVKATATSQAPAPVVTGVTPATVTAVKATATSQAGTPTVTAIQGPTVIAVRALATTAAVAPAVIGGTLAATINDTFTGTDGAAWNATNWLSVLSTAGASTSIQANQGRMNAGTLTTYAGRKGMRYAGGAVADVNITGKFTFVNSGTADGSLQIVTRANSILDWQNSYMLHMIPGVPQWTVQRNVAGVGAQLGPTITRGTPQGTQWNFRFRNAGTALQARTWQGTEPSTWDVDVTDASITGAGYFGLICLGGSIGGCIIDIDDIIAATTARAYQSATPPTTADTDTGQVSLGLEFYATSNSTVTQIHFWQPTGGDPSARTVGIYTMVTGTLIQAAETLTVAGTGWQTQTLATPIPITANTRYKAVVYHPAGAYAKTAGYYTDAVTGAANFVNGALTIPNQTNASFPGQGTYGYGAGISHPTNMFGSSNYWVDVTIST